jgi:hypothetical protein
MAKSLVKVDSADLWRSHLKVKGSSPVPTNDEYDFWKLNATGLSLSDIATNAGITLASVSEACKKVEKFFESRVAIDIAAFKIQQHVRIEAILEESLREFQLSGGKSRTITRKRTPAPEGMEDFGEIIEETIVEKDIKKDPRYLTVAMNALQEQRKIWPGANAPSASSVTNIEKPTTQVNIANIVKNMTPDQEEALKQLEKILDQQDAIDMK